MRAVAYGTDRYEMYVCVHACMYVCMQCMCYMNLCMNESVCVALLRVRAYRMLALLLHVVVMMFLILL